MTAILELILFKKCLLIFINRTSKFSVFRVGVGNKQNPQNFPKDGSS